MTTKWWKAGLLALAASFMAGVPSALGLNATFVETLSNVSQNDGSVISGPGDHATFQFMNADGVEPVADTPPPTVENPNPSAIWLWRLRLYMQGTNRDAACIALTDTYGGQLFGFLGAVGYGEPIDGYTSIFPGDGLTDSWFQFSAPYWEVEGELPRFTSFGTAPANSAFSFVQISVPADADPATSIRITAVLAPPFSAPEMIDDLIVVVSEINGEQGISNSLDAKLTSAREALLDINENNDVSAVNKLQAFINEVEAQTDKNLINEDQANVLITLAHAIIEVLTAP